MVNWIKLDKINSGDIAPTREALHRAMQLVSAAPRSFLPPLEHDETASLHWNEKKRRLESQYFGPKLNVQSSIDFASFKIMLLVEEIVFDEISLHKKSFDQVKEWFRNTLYKIKLDPNQYVVDLPYTLPAFHSGLEAPFDYYDKNAFHSFSILYHNTNLMLNQISEDKIGKKLKVKVWPHHFDMAILHYLNAEDSVGLGLAPGDDYYAQPYFYVTPYPYPPDHTIEETNPIVGHWHTEGFKALILTYDQLFKEIEELEAQLVYDFLKNGLEISSKLLV